MTAAQQSLSLLRRPQVNGLRGRATLSRQAPIDSPRSEASSDRGGSIEITSEPLGTVATHLVTASGIAVPPNKELIQKHQSELNTAFYELKERWVQAMQIIEPGIDVDKCYFNFESDTVDYTDSHGGHHTRGLLDDLRRAHESARGADQGEIGGAIEQLMGVDGQGGAYAALKTVYGTIWGVNGESFPAFLTDVRDASDGPVPFVRNELAEQRLLGGIGDRNPASVASQQVIRTINERYKEFLEKKGVPAADVAQELDDAKLRMEAVGNKLAELRQALESAKTRQKGELDRVVKEKGELEARLQQEQASNLANQQIISDLTTQIAGLGQRERAFGQLIMNLQVEINKYDRVDLSALYSAVAFSAERFLGSQGTSDMEQKQNAKALAEAVFEYLKKQIEAQHQQSVTEAAQNTSGVRGVFRRFMGATTPEKLNQNHNTSYPLAVDAARLILYTLPPHLERQSYTEFVVAHGGMAKRESLEGSIMQYLYSCDRGKDPAQQRPVVSPELQRTLDLLKKVNAFLGVDAGAPEQDDGVPEQMVPGELDAIAGWAGGAVAPALPV